MAIRGFVIAAVALLAVAAVVLTVTGENSDRPEAIFIVERNVIEGVSFPAIDHGPAAAAELVAAWERWRRASFVSTGAWTQTVDGTTGRLIGDVYTAQDPPRRLVIRLGAVAESIDGSTAACSPVENDDAVEPTCLRGQGIGYDERVTDELARFQQYVGGSNRLYDVATDSVCYRPS